MGIGDELIAAGQARKLYEQDTKHRRVRVLDIYGNTRTHAMWEHNPHIATPWENGDFQEVRNGPGMRPYIEGKSDKRWYWREFEPTPATIVMNPRENVFSLNKTPGVIIEPNLKPKASPNKHWGFGRWVEFARLAYERGIAMTQLGVPGVRILPFVKFQSTPDFRYAVAVLAKARAYVGHEGGMHHAAAAVGIPAVVIFGGFISPKQTGYSTHRNLFTGGEPCGYRVPCDHCAEAMAAITPKMVLDELEAIL